METKDFVIIGLLIGIYIYMALSSLWSAKNEPSIATIEYNDKKDKTECYIFKNTNTMLEINKNGFVFWQLDNKGFRTWIIDASLVDKYKNASVSAKMDKNGNFKIKA